jgi:hypothetical protein
MSCEVTPRKSYRPIRFSDCSCGCIQLNRASTATVGWNRTVTTYGPKRFVRRDWESLIYFKGGPSWIILRAPSGLPFLTAMSRFTPQVSLFIIMLYAQLSNRKFISQSSDDVAIATIRTLAADMIFKSNSGHPGMYVISYTNS